MLTRKQKEDIVEIITKKLKDKQIVVFSDFTGLNVSKTTKLRKELKKEGMEYLVVKKNLLKIALKNAGYDPDTLFNDFKGSCSAVFDFNGQVEAPKIITAFAKKKENSSMKIVGGFMDKSALSKADVINIALIPSKEVLLSQMVSTIASPITGFMNVLNGNTKKLIFALQQIQNKKTS